jgi:hypothetical protein
MISKKSFTYQHKIGIGFTNGGFTEMEKLIEQKTS